MAFAYRERSDTTPTPTPRSSRNPNYSLEADKPAEVIGKAVVLYDGGRSQEVEVTSYDPAPPETTPTMAKILGDITQLEDQLGAKSPQILSHMYTMLQLASVKFVENGGLALPDLIRSNTQPPSGLDSIQVTNRQLEDVTTILMEEGGHSREEAQRLLQSIFHTTGPLGDSVPFIVGGNTGEDSDGGVHAILTTKPLVELIVRPTFPLNNDDETLEWAWNRAKTFATAFEGNSYYCGKFGKAIESESKDWDKGSIALLVNLLFEIHGQPGVANLGGLLRHMVKFGDIAGLSPTLLAMSAARSYADTPVLFDIFKHTMWAPDLGSESSSTPIETTVVNFAAARQYQSVLDITADIKNGRGNAARKLQCALPFGYTNANIMESVIYFHGHARRMNDTASTKHMQMCYLMWTIEKEAPYMLFMITHRMRKLFQKQGVYRSVAAIRLFKQMIPEYGDTMNNLGHMQTCMHRFLDQDFVNNGAKALSLNMGDITPVSTTTGKVDGLPNTIEAVFSAIVAQFPEE